VSENDLQRPGPLKVVSVPKAVAAFLLAGLLVLVVLALVLARAQQRMATAEAIRDARTLTNLEASDVIGPLLTDAALRPGPEQRALDAVVHERVLGSHIVRVKIWNAAGTILYSDDAALIGKTFTLEGEEKDALTNGETSAEVTSLAAAENQDEKQFGKLLQVYQGVRTPTGTRLLFETYQPYSVITIASRRMWQASLPVLLAGLALLYLVQAPLAYRMALRLRNTQDEREALLVGSLAASDRERATIAADLHDGIVQGLTGTSYTLAAGADRASDPAAAQAMGAAAGDLRRWVRELRSLVVTITPPALHRQGLEASLADLTATLEVRGIAVTSDITGTDDLDETTEALAYRAAQEAVRNVIRHAQATTVNLSVRREDGHLVLAVRDDGRGLGEDADAARRRGSVGLDLLSQLVSAHGGELVVGPADSGGTELAVTLPVSS
jgi:signal transduction histidine kinase